MKREIPVKWRSRPAPPGRAAQRRLAGLHASAVRAQCGPGSQHPASAAEGGKTLHTDRSSATVCWVAYCQFDDNGGPDFMSSGH